MRQVRAAHADTRTVVLDAGHLVLQRRPAEAAAALTAFVHRCGEATPAAAS
jgi:hypothetical protein